MKTNLFPVLLMSLILVSFTVYSCKKEIGITPPVDQSDNALVGNIIDSGMINSTTRLMRTGVPTQTFTVNSPDISMSGTFSMVSASLYVDNDGVISDGDYIFSDSPSKTPFTFDSGSVDGPLGINNYGTQNDKVVGGKITVSKNGENYNFSVQVELSSGVNFDGSYTGKLGYADSKK